ncbi:hypothetical protein ES708_33256 [subsurface metagenome]
MIENADIVSLAATKITGQIVNAQIANIDFAKITNVEITNAMIVSLAADKITAGTITGVIFSQAAGAVVINEYGLKIKGEFLVLASPAGTYPTRINVDGVGDLLLDPASDTKIGGGSLKPATSAVRDLGESTLLWRNVYGQIFRPQSSTSGGVVLGTSAKDETGNIKYGAGSAHDIFVFGSGGWDRNA